MKKLILTYALITIYMGSFAQIDSTKNRNYNNGNNGNNGYMQQDTMQRQKNDNLNNKCAMTMTNGRIMMLVDGRTVTVDKETTTKNGTVVMMDGTVKTRDGKTIKMEEGDCVDMSGKMIGIKNTPAKKDTKKATK